MDDIIITGDTTTLPDSANPGLPIVSDDGMSDNDLANNSSKSAALKEEQPQTGNDDGLMKPGLPDDEDILFEAGYTGSGTEPLPPSPPPPDTSTTAFLTAGPAVTTRDPVYLSSEY